MLKYAKGLNPEIIEEKLQFREEFHYQQRSIASLHIRLLTQYLMAHSV